MYYEWYKKNNHLYKNLQLDPALIDNFMAESSSSANDFENNTKGDNDQDQLDEEEVPNHEEAHEAFFKTIQDEPFEPNQSTEDEWTHSQTTMFLNKYCESTDIPTVANRVADIIIDYESNNQISVQDEDDFDIDDEIITEEEF
jgi:hypothetical protein